jgi:hypothetical protein
MVLSKDKLAKATNPSTGILYRNPTTEDASGKSDNQTEIVKQIIGSGKKVLTEVFSPDSTNGAFPGLKLIRVMPEETLAKFFLTLLRSRPNIFSLHVKLGDYPSAKEIRKNNKLVSNIQVSKATEYKDLAQSFAELFADKSLNVVEVVWNLQASSPGNFFVSVECRGTNEEEYADNQFFSPAIGVDYFPNN